MRTKNTPANAPAPKSKVTSMPAMIQGSFDFFFTGSGVDGVVAGTDGGDACAGGGVTGAKSVVIGRLVGAVFRGNAIVGACDEAAIVALGSGKSRLVSFSASEVG